MMTPELKAKWIAALRSGDYNQGQNALRDCDNNYCCLGVLCDIIPDTRWALCGTSVYEAHVGDGNSSTAVFPFMIRDQYGLTTKVANNDSDSEYIENIHERLIDMNDNGESFNTIADYIEVNL